MQRRAIVIAGVLCLLLCACKDTTYRSSVPSYPVSIRIDTRVGIFVHFIPTNSYAYTIVDADGYHFDGQTQARKALNDAYGYAGVVIFIDGNGQYTSYDLCCPVCLKRDKPVEIDGFFAICPTCGEEYDLSGGIGVPTKGIAGESLRRYTTIYSGNIITVYN